MLQHCCSHAHPVSILYCLLFSYNEYNYRPRKNAPQRASSRLRNRVPWYGVGCALILLPNDIAISDPARRHRGCDAIRLGFDRLRAPRRWMSGTSDAPPRQAIGVLERQSSNGRVHSRSQASSSDGGEGWILHLGWGPPPRVRHGERNAYQTGSAPSTFSPSTRIIGLPKANAPQALLGLLAEYPITA